MVSEFGWKLTTRIFSLPKAAFVQICSNGKWKRDDVCWILCVCVCKTKKAKAYASARQFPPSCLPTFPRASQVCCKTITTWCCWLVFSRLKSWLCFQDPKPMHQWNDTTLGILGPKRLFCEGQTYVCIQSPNLHLFCVTDSTFELNVGLYYCDWDPLEILTDGFWQCCHWTNGLPIYQMITVDNYIH